eukprot:s2087_g4.t1
MPDESKQVELKEERPLSQYVVLNARGTRITTTPTTLGILALPGTFFGSLDLESTDVDEIFLDHDPQAVGEILTAFSNMRFSATNALAAIRDASLRNSHSMRPLLHFLGLEWMLGLRFPSRFDDFGHCESTCKERSFRECQHEHPDVLQYLVESAGKPCWSHLHQIALVDEQVELFGLGDEAFLVEHGGFIPLGEARLLDHPALESEKQRYWPHAPQSRLVLDLGEGNAVWPTGFTFNFYMPDSHIAQEADCGFVAVPLVALLAALGGRLKIRAGDPSHLPAQAVLSCQAIDWALTTSHLHLQLPQASSAPKAAQSLDSAAISNGGAILVQLQPTASP